MKGYSILLILFVLVFLLFGFHKKGKRENIIYWKKDYKLKWDDFQGLPDTTKNYLAVTTSEIADNEIPVKGQDSLKIVILTEFLKDFSYKWFAHLWDTNFKTEALEHEQIHFDITEVYARKLRQKIKPLISKAANRNSSWIQDQIEEFNHKLTAESWIEQEQFDSAVSFYHTQGFKVYRVNIASDYDTVRRRQNLWRQKVDKELSDLEKYSENAMTIKVKQNTRM